MNLCAVWTDQKLQRYLLCLRMNMFIVTLGVNGLCLMLLFISPRDGDHVLRCLIASLAFIPLLDPVYSSSLIIQLKRFK